MKRVHILARVDPERDRVRIQVRGERKLNQDAVNAAVRVQTVDQRHHDAGFAAPRHTVEQCRLRLAGERQ